METARERARRIAREYLDRGDPTGWFEHLYATAHGDASAISWAEMVPNPGLVDWVERRAIRGDGKRAIVVGCGLGDDAEYLRRLGFHVVAFDISPTAIQWCRNRFPASEVDYRVADLFDSPESWKGAFDLVVEAYTLQVLPPHLRARAAECIAAYVAPGGTLLAIARGRERQDPPGEMPWPLTRDEMDYFQKAGLAEVTFDDYLDREDPPVRRFRAEYRAS